MSNELQKIVKDIKYATGKTLEVIAEEIGYSRAYFTTEVNKGTNEKLKEILSNKYDLKTEQNVPRGMNKLSVNSSEESKDQAYWERLISANEAILAQKQETLNQLELRRQEAENFAKKMEAHYVDIRTDKEKLFSQLDSMQKTIDVSLTRANQYLEVIVRVMRADDAVTMDSLDRLEGHPEGTNRTRSGRIQKVAKTIQNQKDKRQKKGN